MAMERRLVMVSNRVPPVGAVIAARDRALQPVSGLVSALRPVIDEMEALWFGWSGRSTTRRGDSAPSVWRAGSTQFATLDLPSGDANLYYTAFSNRALWPVLHSFPDRAVIRRQAYGGYRRVNRRFAQSLLSVLQPGDLVWVHDYHLFLLGQELRDLGWDGKIGFFLHVPFPSADIFTILPWARPLLEGLLAYDLVGLQIRRYARNLIDTLSSEVGGAQIGEYFVHEGRRTRVGVYPVGTEPAALLQNADNARRDRATPRLRRMFPDQRLILGVDRLDYTKGVVERLLIFEHLLARRRTLRGKVGLVQVSAPSRERVPEYIEVKAQVDQIVGRINGRFSEHGWIPINFHYRSYTQEVLAAFYSEADVCLVTPLRDGMNLVAKEYVAARGDNPGVLVLSKFCGAAEAMSGALIVNPHDIEGSADILHRGLVMSSSERRERWETLVREVRSNTSTTWAHSFLADLDAQGP
jgi:trehalose 6-phosphate synthase